MEDRIILVWLSSPLQEVSKQTQGHSGGAVAVVSDRRGHGAVLGRGRARGAGAARGGASGSAGLASSSSSGSRSSGAGSSSGIVFRVEGAALVLNASRAVALGLSVADVVGVALRVGLLADELHERTEESVAHVQRCTRTFSSQRRASKNKATIVQGTYGGQSLGVVLEAGSAAVLAQAGVVQRVLYCNVSTMGPSTAQGAEDHIGSRQFGCKQRSRA